MFDPTRQSFWKGLIVGIIVGFAFGGCFGYETGQRQRQAQQSYPNLESEHIQATDVSTHS